MARYRAFAPLYDLLSGEPVYVVGRARAVGAMGLEAGTRVLDVGAGTGLNLPWLAPRLGGHGEVTALDRSASMLAVAERKARSSPVPVTTVVGDAAAPPLPAHSTEAPGFDALLATYVLSLTDDPAATWVALRPLLRPGARVAVVDLAPVGRLDGPLAGARGAVLAPLARAAARAGGSDVDAAPWRHVVRDLVDVRSWSLRGGHVQVRVGTLVPPGRITP